MTRYLPYALARQALAEGRRVVLIRDRPPPRVRGWPVKRFVVLGVSVFVAGCWA